MKNKHKVPSEIDPDQAWFWTEEWQAGERGVDEAIRRGEVSGPFKTVDELRKHLGDARPRRK